MGVSSAMSTSNQYIKYTIEIIQNYRNIESNFSNVTVKVRFYRTNTGYTSYGTGTVYCRINGRLYSASVSPSQKITENGIVLFNNTMTVYHEDNGTKTLTCSAWITHDVVTSSEQSYSQALVDIPRGSSIASISGNTFGSPITVTINSASPSFRHTVIYRRPDGAEFIVGEGIETICTFTPALSDCDFVTNKTSAPIGIIVHTYNGSNLVETAETSVLCYVPDHLVPTINNISITDTSTGIANHFGCYIKGKSKLRVEIDAVGSYSSTIAHKISHMNGEIHNRKVFITGAIKGSGSCVTTVTDTRGRTASKTVDYSVHDYFEPYIERFDVTRCDWYGNEDEQGNCCKCTIKAVVSPVDNKNTKDFSIKYKRPQDQEWQSTIVSNENYTLETTYIVYDLDMDSTYEMVLQVSDYFVATRLSRNLPTAYTLVDYNASGKGIAFGQVSTKDALEIDMRTHISTQILFGDNNNDENQVVFRNLAYNQGQTYENDGVYPHYTYICGGWGTEPNAIKIWDAKNGYSPLYYQDTTKRLHYGDNGLYSPNTQGIHLDYWGNIVTTEPNYNGCWGVYNDNVSYFLVNWADKRLFGAYGGVHQAKWLYYNDSGTNGTVTLSDSASNYEVIDIVFKTNDNEFSSTRISSPNGRNAILTGVNGNLTYYVKNASVYVSGNTISFNKNWEMAATTGTTSCYSGNFIYIVAVLGYI